MRLWTALALPAVLLLAGCAQPPPDAPEPYRICTDDAAGNVRCVSCYDSAGVQVDCPAPTGPQPRAVTYRFNGTAAVTGNPAAGAAACDCTFQVRVDGQATGLTLEAVLPDGTDSDGFHWTVGTLGGYGGNPMHVAVDQYQEPGDLEVRIEPLGFPQPTVRPAFEAYVTVWYDQPPQEFVTDL